MQKKQLKYSKFLFIGLLLIGLATLIFKTVTPPPRCMPSTLSVPPCYVGKDFVELPIKLYPQQSTNWCWASSIQMCIEAINHDSIPQCQIATDRVKLIYPRMTATACACPKPECIYPLVDPVKTDSCRFFSKSLPTDFCEAHNIIKSILGKYHLTTQIIEINTTNTLNEVKNNLCAGNPIISILYNVRGAYHIVVIKGYQKIDSSTAYLLVNNPLNDRTASCEGCYHVIPVTDNGKSNIFPSRSNPRGIGTYQPVMYFAVTKP